MNETYYHVRFSDGRYLGESNTLETPRTRQQYNARIFSREGAKHRRDELNSQGADATAVMVTKTGKIVTLK